MPSQALRHFQQDISRARALLSLARTLPTATDTELLLRDDTLRSAWMFGVGALDAYFSDAYTDVVAATLISKNREPRVNLPDFVSEIEVPVYAILAPYQQRANWRWRMAGRKLMENEDMLKLGKVAKSFNPFFSDGHKLWNQVIDSWITRPGAIARVFGISPRVYAAVPAQQKNHQRSECEKALTTRFGNIIQRRHDCIHNCDRPRVSPQPIHSPGSVGNVLSDIEFLVTNFDTLVNTELHTFFIRLGFSPLTIARAGY